MKVCVVGLGYIGLPTAMSLAASGVQVIGVDKNSEIVNSLNDGKMTFKEDGMDELFNFQTKEESAAEKQTEKVSGENTLVEMEFAYMSAFPDHKFKLYTGQRLDDMVSSIKEYGILMPVILWHHEGLYIILSGHNRVNAGKIAGLTKCLVIIKENLSYEDAVLIVTETNLRQRSFDDLSPSEKAYCLKQHYEAIKCQGKRNDLLNEIENLLNPSEIKENETLSENQKRLRSDEKLGEEYGLNRDNVAKYLRIATLVSPLLEMLDEKKISMKSAYDLSFVKEEFMQTMIADILVSGEVVLDTKKSALIHDYAKNKTLTEERIEQILKGEKTKKPKSTAPQPIKVKGNVISRFFTKQESKKEIEETIEKALELYFARMSEEKEQLVW